MTAADPAPGALTPTMPSWSLRGLLAAACAATVAAVWAWTSPAPALLVLLVALALATVAAPASHTPTALLAGCALAVLIGADGVSAWTAAVVFGVHATHLLAALAAVVPWRSTVERSALRPSLDRFVLAQAATQALVLLAWLISRA